MADKSYVRSFDEGSELSAEVLDVPLDSPALTRLLDEVRGIGAEVSRSYNRTYNRHNR